MYCRWCDASGSSKWMANKDKKHLTWNNTTMHINKPKWPGLQKQCLFVHLSLLFFELLQRAPFLIISFIFHCLLSDYLVSHVIKTTAEKPVSGERCKRFQLHGVVHKYHNSLLKQCKVGLNNLLFFLIRSRCSGGEKAEDLKAFMSQISLCYCYKNKT